MTMLDPQAIQALRAVAAARSPAAGAPAQAWAAMQQRLIDGPPAASGLDPSLATPRPHWITAAVTVAAVAVLAVALASWSAGWMAGLDARSDQAAPYSSEPPPAAPLTPTFEAVVIPSEDPTPGAITEPASVTEPTEPTEPTPVTAPASEPPPASRPSRRGDRPRRAEPQPSREPSPGTTLEAELRLLSRANAAIRAGRYQDALDVLATHAREFAAGQLAPEREYKRALALCELGRVEQARAVAEAFSRAHPKSPLRTKARDVCREGAP